MAASFRILPERGIVYMHYAGFTTTADSLERLKAYGNHPDFRPGQRILCDFRDVEEYEHDPVKIMAFQAVAADILIPDTTEILLVLLTGAGKGREIANMIQKSWEGVSSIVPVIAETEERALSLLGQPENRISDLLGAEREKN